MQRSPMDRIAEPRIRLRAGMLLALLCICPWEPASAEARMDSAVAVKLRLAVAQLCPRPALVGFEAQTAIPGSWLIDETRWPKDGPPRRTRVTLLVTGAGPEHGAGELTIERRQVGDRLRQFRVSYAMQSGADGQSDLQPVLLAIADGSCTIQSSRAIRSEGEAWLYLDQLEGDLATLKWTETLQAPWPEGQDSGGVRVGLVDSGLAYDLLLFANRLARDQDGTPVGYDFWDLDPWPYDGDVSRGVFLPIRHGTAVASVLVREAPEAALVPFRYPRPDMGRMGALVERAAKVGVRILAMPLGSTKGEDWQSFQGALAAHDILAVVSAGNDGRDIDQAPVYPAALPLDNIITVTSADAFGRLASGSNWGATHVDVMLPAENIPIMDFRGASGVASGSSYAVPRLAALAARMLQDTPDLTAIELKARILSRAAPSPFERDGVLAAGWIPDPLAD
jgi:hypothetical protein